MKTFRKLIEADELEKAHKALIQGKDHHLGLLLAVKKQDVEGIKRHAKALGGEHVDNVDDHGVEFSGHPSEIAKLREKFGLHITGHDHDNDGLYTGTSVYLEHPKIKEGISCTQHGGIDHHDGTVSAGLSISKDDN